MGVSDVAAVTGLPVVVCSGAVVSANDVAGAGAAGSSAGFFHGNFRLCEPSGPSLVSALLTVVGAAAAASTVAAASPAASAGGAAATKFASSPDTERKHDLQ